MKFKNVLAGFALTPALAYPFHVTAHAEAPVAVKKTADARDKVTRENAALVEIGHTVAQVEEILGPGKERFCSKSVRLIEWKGKGILRPTKVTLSFLNGRLVGKAVTGK